MSDGEWIEWNGGRECPVPAGTLTMVRFRNGRAMGDDTPTLWCWAHDGDEVDIVAYRVLAAPATDPVASPAHYTAGEIECIDAIRAALTPEEFRGYCKGNVIKYTWRERHKGGDESLAKAVWYLERLVK